MAPRLPSFLSAPLIGRHAEDAGRALQLAAVVLLLQSVFWTARVPIVLKLATAALGALSFVHPGGGLLVVAGLVPFGNVLTTRVWDVYPLALAEALVLAFLTGYLVRTWRWRQTGEAWRDSLSTPATLFALVVLASCAVQLVVLQVWHDYPLAYAGRFLSYLVRDYLTTVPDPRPWVEGQGFVATAALLLEGVALMLAARALCRARPGLERRVLVVAVAAGVGAALLNLSEVAEAALRGEEVITPAVLGVRRWTLFIQSLNTSGPYFALVAFLAIGLAAAWRSWPRVLPLSGAVLALVAMWLTGTRSSVVAAIAMATAWGVWALASRTRVLTRWHAIAIAGIAAVLIGVTVVVTNPVGVLGQRGDNALRLRLWLAETGVQILRVHPLVGVGIGQYSEYYRDLASPQLRRAMPSADAHNYFVWVGAVLGLVGLTTFLGLLATALTRAWQRLRANPSDLAFAGLGGGLAAFIITWLSGQPLSVPVVAFTFWLLLGVAAHAVTDNDVSRWIRQDDSGWLTRGRVALVTFVVLLVVSVPIRARQAIQTVDLARVTYGLYPWETEGIGVRYRWTGPRATFFEGASVRAVELPLRAPFDPARVGAEAFEIRIFVNHQRVGMARLTDDRWQQLRVPGPDDAEGDRFWRVDLEVSPTWLPIRVLPGSSDPRALGVKTGEIKSLE